MSRKSRLRSHGAAQRAEARRARFRGRHLSSGALVAKKEGIIKLN